MTQRIDTDQYIGETILSAKCISVSLDGRRQNLHFICECGKEFVRGMGQVRQAIKRGTRHLNCGCMRGRGAYKHGCSDTPEYRVYLGMIQRCYNKNSTCFHNYGGRGVVVCDRWLGEKGFTNFLADMGNRPTSDHHLDKDIRGGIGCEIYSPDTCSWALPSEHAKFRRPQYNKHGYSYVMEQYGYYFPVVHKDRRTIFTNEKFATPKEAHEAAMKLREELGV